MADMELEWLELYSIQKLYLVVVSKKLFAGFKMQGLLMLSANYLNSYFYLIC